MACASKAPGPDELTGFVEPGEKYVGLTGTGQRCLSKAHARREVTGDEEIAAVTNRNGSC